MNSGSEIVVGVVGRPWGNRGQFIVDPRGADPAFVLSRGELRLRRRDGTRIDLPILGSHIAGGRLVVSALGCSSPGEAELIRGAEVLVDRSAFGPPPAGSYYPHELVGLPAVGGSGESIGRVERVIESGGGADLLDVRSGDRSILVPFAEAYCRVDREAGAIVIDPPDGLLDLE